MTIKREASNARTMTSLPAPPTRSTYFLGLISILCVLATLFACGQELPAAQSRTTSSVEAPVTPEVPSSDQSQAPVSIEEPHRQSFYGVRYELRCNQRYRVVRCHLLMTSQEPKNLRIYLRENGAINTWMSDVEDRRYFYMNVMMRGEYERHRWISYDVSSKPAEAIISFEVDSIINTIKIFYLSTSDGIVEFRNVPMSP